MVIGEKLKTIREHKNMSQGDIEKRTGPLRCYISRVENGHAVPAIETLEKVVRAMEVRMYALFMTARRHPNQPFPRPQVVRVGAVPVATHGRWPDFADV